MGILGHGPEPSGSFTHFTLFTLGLVADLKSQESCEFFVSFENLSRGAPVAFVLEVSGIILSPVRATVLASFKRSVNKDEVGLGDLSKVDGDFG